MFCVYPYFCLSLQLTSLDPFVPASLEGNPAMVTYHSFETSVGFLVFFQVSILERRNMAGRVVYKTLEDPWTGSENDKFILLGYLDQLRRDPALLSSEAVLPDLTDELAPVSVWPRSVVGSGQGLRRGSPAELCWEGVLPPRGLGSQSWLSPVFSLNRFFWSGGSTLLLTTSQTAGIAYFTTTGRNIARLTFLCSINSRTTVLLLKKICLWIGV